MSLAVWAQGLGAQSRGHTLGVSDGTGVIHPQRNFPFQN